jgi:hypothetical protein
MSDTPSVNSSQPAAIDGLGHQAIDPNTGLPTPAVAPAPAPMSEQEQYVDEWSKAPSETAPVRTWRDASAQQRTDPNGEYLAAWYDTPVAASPHPSSAPGERVATVQAPATAPVAAPAASPGGHVQWPAGGNTYVNEDGAWMMDANGRPMNISTMTEEQIAALNQPKPMSTVASSTQ